MIIAATPFLYTYIKNDLLSGHSLTTGHFYYLICLFRCLDGSLCRSESSDWNAEWRA